MDNYASGMNQGDEDNKTSTSQQGIVMQKDDVESSRIDNDSNMKLRKNNSSQIGNGTELELKTTVHQTDLPSNHFQEEYLQKVKTLEHLIDVIKYNAYEKNKKELEEKLRYKNELETNVEILSSYVKLNRMQKRNFGSLSKSITRENERMIFNSDKAVRESDFFERQIPYLRGEINDMKNEIAYLYEETKELKNDRLLLDRHMFMLNDEIKRFNKLNSDTFAEKENLRNAIKLLKKHSMLTNEKIKNQEEAGKEFFSSLTLLAQKTKMDNENYSTRASFTKSI